MGAPARRGRRSGHAFRSRLHQFANKCLVTGGLTVFVRYDASAGCGDPPNPRVMDAPDRRDRRRACSWPAARLSGTPSPARPGPPGIPPGCPAACQPCRRSGSSARPGRPGRRRRDADAGRPGRPPAVRAGPGGSLPQGDPQWTVDTMADGTYIFIYAPTGSCLAAAGRRGRGVLALRRCDLGAGAALAAGWAPPWRPAGHQYAQYRNVGSGRCLATAAAAPLPSPAPPALVDVRPGAPGAPARLVLWWAGPDALRLRRDGQPEQADLGRGRTGRAACPGAPRAARRG